MGRLRSGALVRLSSAWAVVALGGGAALTGCTAEVAVGELPDGSGAGGNGEAAQGDDQVPDFLEGSVSTDSHGNAEVYWLTDEVTTGVLEYGWSEPLDQSVASEEVGAAHLVQLSGLIDGRKYLFRAHATDMDGNETTSPIFHFVQGVTGNDTEGPVVSDVAAVLDGEGAVTVTWTTDEPGTSRVEYGLDESYGLVAEGEPDDLVTEHAVVLADLAADEFFHYRVVSADADGNATASPDQTFFTGDAVTGDGAVTGELVAWHPVTISFEGPLADERDVSPNPFLDYRLVLELDGPSGERLLLPGFFDGDGEGGGTGRVWRVRFAAPASGTWAYTAHFDAGDAIAVETSLGAGTPVAFDGATGTVTVSPVDPEAEGFYRWGMLEYVGEHYLKFADGPYWLKGGTDSPENLLGYAGFDNTFDQPGGASTSGMQDGVHRYPGHVADFGAGGLGDASDPLFVSEDTGVSSKGLVGALNYLASMHVNSVYFLPMNLGGDGRETCPFVGYVESGFDKTHYDVSKLTQWNRVFEHATRRGIALQFVLGETEVGNENYLDGGTLGVERKLFYREMVARFGHNLAIKWNLSEESDFSASAHQAFAQYLRDVDPYDHPVAFHTDYLGSGSSYGPYSSVLGDARFTATSIQGAPEHAGGHVEYWREESAKAGQPWVLDIDELGPAGEGLTDANADDRRVKALWDVYLSGGNLEWYGGYHSLPLGGDMRLEDFRTREEMWRYTWNARSFVETHLPFWEMEPADHLVTGETAVHGGAEVFAKPGEVYAIYYPDASDTGSLNLSGAPGNYALRWYDPRSGAFVGGSKTLVGGAQVALGAPPGDSSGSVFEAQDGIVVMEVESVPPQGAWAEEASVDGYTGSSYYRWDGPDHFDAPGNGVVAYPFVVDEAGVWQVRVRNHHDHPQADLENDCWMRMDGGPWTKVFSNDGEATIGVWNWQSVFDPASGPKEAAHYDLEPGQHLLEISGRSHGYRMDRVHVFLPSTPGALDPGLPESPTVPAAGGSGEDWVALLTRV